MLLRACWKPCSIPSIRCSNTFTYNKRTNKKRIDFSDADEDVNLRQGSYTILNINFQILLFRMTYPGPKYRRIIVNMMKVKLSMVSKVIRIKYSQNVCQKNSLENYFVFPYQQNKNFFSILFHSGKLPNFIPYRSKLLRNPV